MFSYTTGDQPLAGYTIKCAIGRGGFGEVYYAVSDGGKEVALKLVQRHLDVELRGVSQCLNLKHPNLLTVYDVRQSQNGDYWVVMEHVTGQSLADVLGTKPNGMPPRQVVAWLRGICNGLGHLHDQGIAHRDLKPDNIFLDQRIVKIGDYGLAKHISASHRSGQTESIGTVHYVAPEISSGRYGKEIDLYALGVILYEMLTGHVPFDGQSVGEILMKHLTAEPNVSILPALLQPVVTRLMAKQPEQRYPSAQDMLTDLEARLRCRAGFSSTVGASNPCGPSSRQPGVEGDARATVLAYHHYHNRFAAELLKDREVIVGGKLLTMDQMQDGTFCLELRPFWHRDQAVRVNCLFPPELKASVAAVSLQDWVEVRGKCSGCFSRTNQISVMTLSDCSFTNLPLTGVLCCLGEGIRRHPVACSFALLVILIATACAGAIHSLFSLFR